jgi:tyrosinase
MKIQLQLLATCTLCSAVAIRLPGVAIRLPGEPTFQLFPPEVAKSDAESAGVFQPEPDRGTTYRNASDKASGGVDSDVDAAGTCTQPTIRVEWRDMSDDDKNSFIGAVKCLLGKPSTGGQYSGAQSRYEDLVSVHQQMTGSIHMVGQFLPWHRYYLSIYESILREECQYGGPMPWWDESKDAADFTASPLFTDQWFGPIPIKGPNGEETCLGTGVSIRV